MGCILSSDESSCSTMFGNCANKHCQSACMKEAANVEDAIDAALKKVMHDHIHAIVEAKFGKCMADLVESGAIQLINIDIIPHTPPTSIIASTEPVTVITVDSPA